MNIIGYYAAWEPEKIEHIRFDAVTHINYSFAIPTIDGDLLPLNNGEFAKRLIEKAHENNVKVSLSLGGWSWLEEPLEPVFVAATKTVSQIDKLTDSVMEMVREYNFDGVDMDWEHPRVANGTYKQYENLVVALSKKLHDEGKLCTAAVIGGVDEFGNAGGIDTGGANIGDAVNAQTQAVFDAVDWLNVMAYDGPGNHHSSFEYAKNSINYWKNERGFDSEKLALGVPFYGKGASYTIPGAGYDELTKLYTDAHLNDFCEHNGNILQLNSIELIKRKTNFAKEENLNGIMIWELSQDSLDEDKNLQLAIKSEINK